MPSDGMLGHQTSVVHLCVSVYKPQLNAHYSIGVHRVRLLFPRMRAFERQRVTLAAAAGGGCRRLSTTEERSIRWR